MTLNDAFDTVADTDMWMEAGAVFAGFLAPSVARRLVEPRIGMDLPDEVWGILVIVAGTYAPEYSEMVQLGGAVYTADRVASRFGVQEQVRNLGGN